LDGWPDSISNALAHNEQHQPLPLSSFKGVAPATSLLNSARIAPFGLSNDVQVRAAAFTSFSIDLCMMALVWLNV